MWFHKLLAVLLCSAVLLWIVIVHNYFKKQSTRLRRHRNDWLSNKRSIFFKSVNSIPVVKTEQVNCKAIINNEKPEIERAMRFMDTKEKESYSPHYYIAKTKSCSRFLKRRRYIREPLSREEAEFPIAYSIMIYMDIEQFERLLRAIYRPQNYYCIHVDAKSPRHFFQAVQSISACFSNVFMASRLLDVRWGEFTVLEADLICMKDLWQKYKSWKYFINLTGQEFPLRTNNELVEILKTYKGTADVSTTSLFVDSDKRTRLRLKYKHHDRKPTRYKIKMLPYDLTLTKGSCHVVLPRSFVSYIFRSWLAKDFLESLRYTHVPDETYVPTLNYSPQLNIPGMYAGDRPGYVRFKNWDRDPCHGKIVRGICVNGVGDLHHITKQPHFFVNKFHLEFQYLALDCMEEWLYNRTRAYYQGQKIFDVTPYIYEEDEMTPSENFSNLGLTFLEEPY